MAVCGLDVGSKAIKAVVMSDGQILGKSVLLSSDEAEIDARKAVDEALKQAGLSWDDLDKIVATGRGRKLISFAQKKKTSPTCLARGINKLHPEVRTLLDVGAETSTAIRISPKGAMEDSVGNDRCASGTGAFLEVIARLLKMPLEEMAKISLEGEKRAEISNMCAIFAEQEVISHIHRVPPTPKADIIKGIHGSMALRVAGLAKRTGIKPEVAMTGGVARNVGFLKELEDEVGGKIIVPEDPELIAAIGAASFGSK